MSYEYERMPFGKYKGYKLDELPTAYIVYAIEKFDLPQSLQEDLKSVLIKTLELPIITKDDINKVFKGLAHTYHPDKKGGCNNAFKAIQEFKNVMINWL